MLALSALMVRAELASFMEYPSPSLGTPFCHAGSRSVLPLLWSAWVMTCSWSPESKNTLLPPASSQIKWHLFTPLVGYLS